MLRMAYRYAARIDVGDIVADDTGVYDIVDHGNSVTAAVLHYIADKVDRIAADYADHSR